MALIKPIGYDPIRCKTLVETDGLSGIILTSNENVFYSTGLPVTRGQANPILFALSNKFPPYSVIDSDGIPTPVVWGGAIGHHELWAKDTRTSFFPGGTTEELLSLVEERFSRGSKIGVESSMPFSLAKGIQDRMKGVEMIVIDNLFENLRIVKTSEEITKLQKSLDIAEKAVKRVQDEMGRDTTVMKLVQESKKLIFELGGSAVDHATIAIGNSNPEILEDFGAAEKDLIILDIGAILDGYVSDTRRLSYVGAVPGKLRDLNATMAEIVLQSGKSLSPGKTFSEICVEVEARYREYHLEPLFLHAGHSIGIQTEESWITRDSERKIEENMVFNVELYSQYKDNGGAHVGTEDTFVVRKNGGEQISHLPHEIREVHT